jgi:hypothetical protein
VSVSPGATKVLYVLAALLEVAGVGGVIWGLDAGRRRAHEFKAEKSHLRASRGFRKGTNARASEAVQIKEQQVTLEQEQTHQEQEIVGLLSGQRSEWIGALLLVAGIVVATIANIANTH